MKHAFITIGAGVAALLVSCGGGLAVIRYPTAGSQPPAEPVRWSFDTDPVGEVPPGAVVFSGTWAVRAEADAPSPPNAL